MAILVVDDSRAMRMIVRRELRKAGYDDVVEAENGAVALDTISGGGVDLVLSDWNMPDMNGIDLLTALRSSGNQVAFGFVTSESAVDIRQRAFEVGAHFVITKPFTGEDLGRQIDLALGSGGQPSGGVSGGAEQTLAGVLEGLLERKVTTSESDPPRPELTRALAVYSVAGEGTEVYGVFEMSVAAAFACALARIPPGQAAEWAKAHAFNEAIEANFYEVANVLAQVAAGEGRRCVLEEVDVMTEGEQRSEIRRATAWTSTMTVEIEAYPPGRLGFVTVA